MRFVYIEGNYIDADKVSFIGKLINRNYAYGVEVIVEGMERFIELGFEEFGNKNIEKDQAEKIREKVIGLIIPRHLEF